MMHFRDWPLRTKVTALVMGTCCIALISASAIFIQYDTSAAKRKIVDGLSTLAQVIADNSSAAVLFNSPRDASDILSALAAEPSILVGDIYLPTGERFAVYTREADDTLRDVSARMDQAPVFHSDHVHVWKNIILDQDTLGVVHLMSDLDELDESSVRVAETIGLAVVLSLLLSLLFSAQLQRIIVRPILLLSSTAERVSTENDYSIRVDHTSGDEVGALVNEFNTMLTRIELTSTALHEAHDHLEQRVRERTDELESEIAERKDRERELMESRARLQEEKEERHRLAVAIEQSPDGIIIAEANGAIEYVNSAFERLFHMDRRIVLHRSANILCSAENDDDYYKGVWDTVSAGNIWSDRYRRRTPTGGLQFLDATISPIRNKDDRITNYVAVCRDVTSEVGLENQLRQSQKLEAVGSLAAGIAHEINTPIQFVGDNLQFMRTAFEDVLQLLQSAQGIVDRFAGDGEDISVTEYRQLVQSVDLEFLKEELPRAIAQSEDGVHRVATIVQAMKRFSHPDSGDQKSFADLNEAIRNTLTVARNELKYVSDIVTELDPDLPPVSCHLGELNQVILNMLINAAHAIGGAIDEQDGGKGTIMVRSRREGDDVVIEIADTGSGVPPEVRERIFDPFFTTKGVGRGTGQGLAIARSVIVEKHGGTIDFESELGKGTTFYIRLPIEAPASPRSQARTSASVEVK